jgi:hypothetical protein
MKKQKINSKSNNYILHFFIGYLISIIIIYLGTGFYSDRYYKIYPTLYVYPNNYQEIKIVEEYVKKRDQAMYNFIKLTDETVVYAFQDLVDESYQELIEITQQITIYIIILKILFNRARPWQINKNLDIYNSISAATPAFPSGHSAEAFYLAKRLSVKYPEKREKLYEIAEKCGKARIYGGLHYPSDHEFSKFLVKIIP